MVHAAAAIARGRHEQALTALRDASDYELGTIAALVPIYFRGLAYLGTGDGERAGAEFKRLLDHRGTDPFAPVCALAQLGLARSLAMKPFSPTSASTTSTTVTKIRRKCRSLRRNGDGGAVTGGRRRSGWGVRLRRGASS